MATNGLTYIKNVGKSFGYAMADQFEKYNPVVINLTKQAKETYEEIKSFSFKSPSLDEKSLKGQIKDSFSDAFDNLKDDLRTGNWYNKERQAKSDDAMMKALGFDMDLNFDFDEDWGDDFDSNEDKLASAVEESNANNTRVMVSAMDQVGYKISASVSEATMESASYIVKSNKQATKALYNLNQKGFNQVTQSLLAVNNSIVGLAKIGEPLTAHMSNSSIFFTKTTETLNRMDKTLQQIAKNTTPAPSALNTKVKYASGTLADMFGDDGVDINAWKDMIKDSFKDNKDLVDMGLDFIKGMKSDGSYGKNISAMTMMTKFISGVIIPATFKESMKNFNDTLKYGLGAAMIKGRNYSFGTKGGIPGMILDVLKESFLPKDGYKGSINTANYEKGNVSWDGIARKALVEVIPEYLSGIYRVLSGEDKVYNYDRGRFVTRSSVKADIQKQKVDAAKNAGGDFRDEALRILDSKNLSASQKKKYQEQIESYFFNAFTTDKAYYDIGQKDFDARSFGITDPAALQILISALQEGSKNKKLNINKIITDMDKRRTEFGDSKRREEASGTSMEIYTRNGFETTSAAGLDQYNHSSMFYLQGIYQYTGFLADNIGYIGGSTNTINKRDPLKKGGDPSKIFIPNTSSHGDKTKREANNENINSFIDEDEQKEEDRKERNKNIRDQLNDRQKSIKDKLIGMFKGLPAGALKLYNKPFDATAKLLDGIGVSIDKMIWGDEANPEKGIFGYMFEKAKTSFDDFFEKHNFKQKFNDFLDKMFGVKDEDGKRTGGKFSEFINDTGDNLKKAGSWAGNTVKQFFGFKGSNNGTAAYGRKVTRTGIVAVSEGELIIPSEYNPFYHGTTNKARQIRNEQNALNNFYGSYAEGGVVGNAKQGFDNLLGGLLELLSGLKGSSDKEKEKKDKNLISELTSKFLKEAGDNKGAIGAGAVIGGGLSLLTGAAVGPLFGAAIGAASGLIINSKTVQSLLFGEVDEETGEVNGGLLGKNISNFFVNNVPTMAKGAVLGGGAGLFMGSPVLGAVLGSTVGYITSSESAKKYLFGELDEHGNRKGGMIPKELQESIKRAVPNMTIGALGGLAIGPFGIAGNLILGAGLGYMASSSKFHDYMFGNEEKGVVGLTEKLKDKIFDNLDSIFHNAGNAFAGFAKNLAESISNKVSDFLTGRIKKSKESGILGKVIGAGGKAAGWLADRGLDLTGFGLGAIEDRLVRGNLRRGYKVYDKNLKRNLLAGERVSRRSSRDNSTFGNFDRVLSSATTAEELQKMKDALSTAKDPKRAKNNAIASAINSMKSSLPDSLGGGTIDKIGNAVRKGNIDQAIKLVQRAGLSESETNNCIEVIQEAYKQVQNADNIASESQQTLKNWKKNLGINFKKPGDINKAMDQIDYELKNNDKFSEATKKENKIQDWRDRVLKVLENLGVNIAAMTGGKTGSKDLDKEAESISEVAKNAADNINGAIKGSQEAGKIITTTDFLGNVHKHTVDSKGNTIQSNSDSETVQAEREMDEFKSNIGHISGISTAIAGLTGMFGSFKNKLLGNDEKKEPGLLSKLLSNLNGEDGPLSWLTSIFTNSKVGKLTKNLMSKVTLGGILSNIVGPTLFGLAFSGKFDEGFGEIFKTGNGKDSTTDDNGNKLHHDKESGLWIDENGNPVSMDQVNIKKGSTGFSDRVKYNTARGIATNTKSLASYTFGKTSLGKKATSLGKAVINSIGIDDAAKAARTNLADTILDGCIKFTQALKKVPALSGMANKLDDMGLALAEKATTKLASEGAESILKLASNAVIWVRVAFIVVDFTTGYEDARTTLGIVSEPTVGQKILSGLLRAVKNFIPIIGTLLPDSMIVDVFCDFIAPALGINVDELKASRQQAQATVDQWNANHADNQVSSVEEYNKKVLEDYTWTERIGNQFKTTWGQTKQGFNLMKNGIKEKGLGGYIKDTANNMMGTFKETYDSQGGGISGVFHGMGSVFEKMLPGIFGEIAKANNDIMGFASKGDLKSLWGITLKDFEGGKDKGDGITTAMPSLFAKIVGQIPLFTTKIQATPLALTNMLMAPVKDFLKNTLDKTINGFKIIKDQISYGEELMHKEDSDLEDYFDVPEAEEGDVLGSMARGAIIGSRLIGIPVAMLKKVGKNIGEDFTEFAKSTKKNALGLVSNTGNIFKLGIKGKVKELWNYNIQEDKEDPLNGLVKFITKSAQGIMMPISFVSWIGQKSAETTMSAFKIAKDSFLNIISNNANMAATALKGDVEGLWNYEIQDNPENPLNGINKLIVRGNQILNLPIAGVSWVGHKAADKVSGVVDKAKAGFKSISETIGDFKDLIKEGNVAKLLDSKYEEKEGDPLAGIGKVLHHGLKLVSFVPTIVSWGANSIFDKTMDTVDIIKTDYSNYKDAIEELKDDAKDGDIEDVVGAKVEFNEKNPLKGIFKTMFGVNRMINTVTALVNSIDFEEIFENAKDFVSGEGSGLSGGKSGIRGTFVSQNDPRYSNMKIGDSTVGNLGCAPAVASMVANGYGRGMSMKEAVNAASNYQNKNGTEIGYFKHVLGSRNIDTQYISGANNIMNQLRNGHSVVLLGRNSSNTSKTNSPFGPNNHYVLATGLDGNGNIIVNDPENNRPTVYGTDILNSASIGINTSGGAGKSLADANLGIWSTPSEKEFNEAIKKYRKDSSPFHGNAKVFLQAAKESGLDPRYILAHAAVESAWGTSNYAKNRNNYFGIGAFDSNPDMAYTFGSGNDGLATGIIEGAKWISKNYYNGKYGQTTVNKMRYNNGVHQYCTSGTWTSSIANIMSKMPKNTKLSYETTPSDAVPSIDDVSTSSSSSSTNLTSSSSSSGGILSTISSAFTSALGKIFGESSGDSTMSGSTDDNIVTNVTGKGNAAQKAIVAKVMSRLGKNQYTQSANRTKVGEGWSDCSSLAQWAYKKAIGVDPGSWTGAQIENPKMVKVDQGKRPDISKLEAGDLMFWKSKGSNSVGHVEIYDGNGNTLGHGSGVGPKKRTVEEYTKIREGYGGPYAYSMRYKDIDKAKVVSGGSSGLLLKSRFNNYSGGGSGLSVPQHILRDFIISGGGSSATVNNTRRVLQAMEKDVRSRSGAGTISSSLAEKLLKSIISILQTIANNTNSVNKIYKVLAEYTAGNLEGAKKAAKEAAQSKDTSSEVDQSIVQLVGALAEIAKG